MKGILGYTEDQVSRRCLLADSHKQFLIVFMCCSVVTKVLLNPFGGGGYVLLPCLLGWC